ncbi:MAG: hypothetical protein VW443_10625 [Pseudomonadales bacterium]
MPTTDMRHPALQSNSGSDAFTDLLFNALLGFVFMFAIAFMLISDPTKSGAIETHAEMLVTIRWPDEHPDDVDAIVEDPRGEIVWYYNRDSDLMHLDRDDRGVFADQVSVAGQLITHAINQETITLRGTMAGEYIVNLLHYKANYDAPLPVTVKVEKLNPVVTVVYYGEHELTGNGDELTAIRFTLNSEGDVTETNRLQKSLLVKVRKKA